MSNVINKVLDVITVLIGIAALFVVIAIGDFVTNYEVIDSEIVHEVTYEHFARPMIKLYVHEKYEDVSMEKIDSVIPDTYQGYLRLNRMLQTLEEVEELF